MLTEQDGLVGLHRRGARVGEACAGGRRYGGHGRAERDALPVVRSRKSDLNVQLAGGVGRDAVGPRRGDPASVAQGAHQRVVEHVTAIVLHLTARLAVRAAAHQQGDAVEVQGPPRAVAQVQGAAHQVVARPVPMTVARVGQFVRSYIIHPHVQVITVLVDGTDRLQTVAVSALILGHTPHPTAAEGHAVARPVTSRPATPSPVTRHPPGARTWV
ncbi:hypothetical protein SHJG_7826 [Streptomyces hygroscopicus subsp. jinggangensis 5008]|nr:hypothetical protein SHJG_7826 [Streptomyces hygroscopicus subsp. jinggangensis 5008]AGF67250.1 hypothetical protein SHJGH_7588 [Streptomyces hygroscopicus subsp. jinggangensis TL01]